MADLDGWISAISNWAANQPHIAEVYLFGSFVRGNPNPDSDLDIAVIIPDVRSQNALGIWIAYADGWAEQLQKLIPIPVDLQIGNPEISETVVGPAVASYGQLIFKRGDTQ